MITTLKRLSLMTALLLLPVSTLVYAQSPKAAIESDQTRQKESYFITLRKVSNIWNTVILEIYTQDTRTMRVDHFNAETNALIGSMEVGGSSKPSNGLMARHEYRGDIAGNHVKMDVKLPNGVTLRVSKTLGASMEYINVQTNGIIETPYDDGGSAGGGAGGCSDGRVSTTVRTVACGRNIDVVLCCTPPVVLVWDDYCNITCN